ncbi:DEAD/DEAH box helicase [Halobacillus salinarum]|uniref:DEAD/DEAH box helicase n=1 Tax=Halobacillus salinarum TaxID=2932257 RepID=A0ABY4EMZ5_9BACI|nr:DEAD/DEAH box helicase [Halobacillus salinarum]UOQ45835.1 DEAD/DEAH box helicase [Halobacillus salinarum]
MQSYLLQPNDIIKITGKSYYDRGKRYYELGKVYGLSHNSAIHSWRAVVTGTHDYEVRVFFFEDDDLEATCECPAYEKYFCCKHIAAVLISIREWAIKESAPSQSSTLITSKNDTGSHDRLFAGQLFETFRQRRENRYNAHLKKPLHIEYYVHLQSLLGSKNLGIELKIGEDYMYVIKNIRQLLQHIKQGQPYRLSKKFSYDPDEHQWSKEDTDLLQLLHKSYEQELFYERQWNQSDQKILTIPPSLAEEMLSKLACRSSQMVNRGTVEGELHMHDSFPEMSFYISEERGSFHLYMDKLKAYEYLSNYHLLYKDGSFFPLDEEKESVIRTLNTLLPYNSNGNHTVNYQDMEGIVSHVLPELETIADIQLDEAAQRKILQTDLQAAIYLDFAQWTLTIDVHFNYGDYAFNPFNHHSTGNQVIIQRNTEKEQAIIQIIEQAEFKFDGEMVYIDDESALDDFVNVYLKELNELAEVFLSPSVKAMLHQQDQELKPDIQIASEGSWLDINFTIEGISSDDVTEALKAAIERKRYYRLSNGALLSLMSDSFQRFQRLASELELTSEDINEQSARVSHARSLQVDSALHPTRDESSAQFNQLVELMKAPQSLELDPPNGLRAELRPYQLTGFRWFKTLAAYHFGGILADDMGLGKTLQTISFLLSEKEQSSLNNPVLIVAPSSLLYNWRKEVEKFAPVLSTVIIAGDPSTRSEAMRTAASKDLWITSYPLLRQDEAFYKKQHFHTIIFDEAQAIKNEATKTANAARHINAKHRFALSGTPIENSLNELWSLFRTIMPGFYKSKRKFLQLSSEKIARMTRPFILRRMKEDVLEDLPEKIDSVQYSELTRDQKEVYLAYLEKIQSEINATIATKGIQKGKLEILAGLTRLRQICCHPSLFLENYNGESGKLEQLKELVKELKAGGHRILIFSQFSSMLTLLYEELTACGLDSFYLDGSTKTKTRMDMVDQFNEGEKEAFLISLKAGGTGLNLTGADTVILYDLWWNPAIEEQAAGRAHRIGQEKVVQVIRMISEGTIEERIYQLQQKKRDLVDRIIQPGESMLSSLTENEIRELLQ